ncbi:carbohydrate kinase family protein [Deinococcus sp. QL22]|uniref:carbohydrate kinase family protein n=1 Tax=Deinococcus sp. QL22 TaxID=2939437 RepID=UPI0020176AC8|nr:carbohydrate kinase family protein [Deinococcus sp. QL22]UQN07732.1 carbohydrate kinase family protein [Deinococcus sp. QL22]
MGTADATGINPLTAPASAPARVVVVGGANVDLKAHTLAPVILGTSNPGLTTQTAGGVARNIAENLARLGVAVSLVSAVGRDSLGDALLDDSKLAGVDVRFVMRVNEHLTGTYMATLDHEGELLVAVSDMTVLSVLTPTTLHDRRAVLRGATWVVADGNLTEPTLNHLMKLAAEVGIPVAFEPVSVPKALQIRSSVAAGFPPHTITPNLLELGALVGRDVPDRLADIRAAAEELHAQGIDTVWVRRGQLGSLLSMPGTYTELPTIPAKVADVTGAGDAMLAAYLAALLAGVAPVGAARQGHAAAALTVESTHTVSPTMTREAVVERLG